MAEVCIVTICTWEDMVGFIYGSSGMYGGGMYNGGFGGPMGGYGLGGGPQDPNNPDGAPPSLPGFWFSFQRAMQGVVNFFGRISILRDQNTQAFHMFMTALLQANVAAQPKIIWLFFFFLQVV